MQVKRQDFGEITELVNGLSQCSNSILESLVLRSNGWLGGELPYSLGLALKMLKDFRTLEKSFLGFNPRLHWKFVISTKTWPLRNGTTIPENTGKLSMLVSLDLHDNYQEGVLTETHFQNLTRLTHLDLSVVSTTDSLVLYV